MIKFDQTKLYSESQNGNCFAASLASILEMPIESVPEFEDMDEDIWWDRFIKWLHSIGFTAVHWNEPIKLPGYYLVMGTSPRDKAINHQVIYRDGELIHDPHPSRDGVTKVKEVMVLVPLDPADVLKTSRDRYCKHWMTCLAKYNECPGALNCADGETHGPKKA